ncbi:MAG: N-acyl-D-glutamate deacylase, partial [Pseudomonadota bacterium]
DRVWQMTPATDDGALTLKLFMLTSGRLYGKPLKMTALAALDSVNNRQTKTQALLFAHLLNSRVLDGNFKMQCLAAPFRIYSEGVVSPLAEANPLMRQLIETELEDREARYQILDDPEFVEAFRAMWARGKQGFNMGHLRRRLRLEREFLTRDLNDMHIFRVPVPHWVGETLQFAYLRYRTWCEQPDIIDDPEEAEVFNALGKNLRDDAEFFLGLLKHYDRDLYWHYVNANKDPRVVKELLLHPKLLPGFNDRGAHDPTRAYFDGTLRALAIAVNDSEQTFSHMVGRLTREPAEFFGLDVGRLELGSRADAVLLDPQALRQYDGEASVQYLYRELFDCHQLVNRSDGVVAGVYVGGQPVWDGQTFTTQHGNQALGQALRVQ